MGIDFGKLRERSAQEKKQQEEKAPPKELGDALEELNLGMLGGRPPSRVGTAKPAESKKDE